MALSLPSRDALRPLAAPMVAAAIRALGSTVALYRRTKSDDDQNRTRYGGWESVRAGIKCRLAVDRVEELRTAFGAETAGTVHGEWSVLAGQPGVAPALDLETHDYAVVVTKGFLSGTRYHVAGAAETDVAATVRLSLAQTTEAIP